MNTFKKGLCSSFLGAWKSNSLSSTSKMLKRGILVRLKQNRDICSALTIISFSRFWFGYFLLTLALSPAWVQLGSCLHLLSALLSASETVPSQIKLHLSLSSAYDGEARLRRERVWFVFLSCWRPWKWASMHCSLAKLQIASADLELGFCAKNHHLSAAVCAQFADIFKNNCYYCLQTGLAGSQIEMLLFLHYDSNYQRIKVAQLAASHQLHIIYIDMAFHYFIWSFSCSPLKVILGKSCFLYKGSLFCRWLLCRIIVIRSRDGINVLVSLAYLSGESGKVFFLKRLPKGLHEQKPEWYRKALFEPWMWEMIHI